MEWDPYKAMPSALWICQNIYEYVEYDQTVSGYIDTYYMALDLEAPSQVRVISSKQATPDVSIKTLLA